MSYLPTANPVPVFATGQVRRIATNSMALAMWASSLAALVIPVPRPVTEAGVAIAMMLTLQDVSKSLRLPLFVCAAILAMLTLRTGDMGPLLAGLDFAAPLAAFLVSVSVLRASMTGGAQGAMARGRFDALPQAGQRSAILLLSFALSAVFLVGVFPLLSPLVTTRDQRQAARLAASALFGGALSFLWSPFSVGTAFATATVGLASGLRTTAITFGVALCGVAVGLVVHGRLQSSVLRQAACVVRPLLLPLGLAITATLTATLTLSLRVTQVVPLVAPLVILTLALRSDIRRPLTTVTARDAINAVPASGAALKDLTVFAVGFALAQALTDSGIFAAITNAVVAWQIGSCIPATLMLLTVALALLGVPAMVCAGLVAAAASSLMGHSPLVDHLVLVSCAWSFASMLSVTSGTLTVVASAFGVSLRPLVLGRNLLAILAFGALVAALTSLNS